MTIIFDFNRTIYDPETGALYPGVLEMLASLQQRGAELYLVSRLEPGRASFPRELGLEPFFTKMYFVSDKAPAIKEIAESAEGDVYVVGDHLHIEIRLGNMHGLWTVWVQQGSYAALQPETPFDVPWRTITDVTELHTVLP